MKIYGPYMRKDNRLIIVLYSEGRTTSMSYPKYLLEQHLGRSLGIDETVDHIDGNPLNNDLSNLQILSRADNARKSVKLAEMVSLTCKTCGSTFSRRAKLHEYNINVRKIDGPFCSKSCVGMKHH